MSQVLQGLTVCRGLLRGRLSRAVLNDSCIEQEFKPGRYTSSMICLELAGLPTVPAFPFGEK